MKVGIIGAGAIAKFLLEQLNKEQSDVGVVTALYVRNKEKYKLLAEQYGVELYTEIEEFVKGDIDIVVEAAELEAVKELVPKVVRYKSVVIISVGALTEAELLEKLQQLATSYKQKVYLPSGAIGGLDLLQNAQALGGVTNVLLTTTKPAGSLSENNVSQPYIIFEGNAQEAIKKFPKNMNVSIVLALAGLGFENTMVKLIADPKAKQNVHEITIQGEFGEASITVKNNPLPTNPKTSYLAAMSILGTLKRLGNEFYIGS